MSGRYQAYPEYSDSEIKWIDNYPATWKITRVKFESYVKARVGWHGLKSDDFTDEGPYLVTGSDFRGPFIKWQNCYHCDLERYEQDPYIQLKEGDLLITKDGTIGKVALVSQLNGKATLNSGVFVVRPLSVNYTSRFYFWLLQSSVFTGFVDYNKTGSTIVHLYQDTFVNFKFAMPSFPEQTLIAKFLDYETAKIDRLIEKQQELIELLKEKRQAVISHAVTQGLNPQAPMKESGVEWLGQVPEHWEVMKISHLAVLRSGDSITSEQIKAADKYPVYGGNGLRGYFSEFNLEGSYILIGRQGALCGNINYGKGRFWASEHAIVVYPQLPIKLEWLGKTFEAMNLNQYSVSAAQPGLAVSNITCLRIPFPSLDEQSEIAKYIDKISHSTETLVSKCNEAIRFMQERRTALISAAVTGKIDVRNWQTPESESTNEKGAE